MNRNAIPSAAPRCVPIKKIIGEAALVAVVGAFFAFAANGLSPRGLNLTRNYFPAAASPPAAPAAGAKVPALSPAQQIAAELRAKGLQAVDVHRAAQLFHDPRRQDDAIVFIDARAEPEYAARHIPGAREFDPYRPEKFFPAVLPVCQAAEQIIVYCHGGDCDDSVSAAVLLRDVGIPPAKLSVFTGGITEWIAHGLPVETGARNSGQFLNTEK